ncbi:FSH1-domain-containing protein [Mycena filopes]|nr:FSH1-domain-containing protein [Mycena filopes]
MATVAKKTVLVLHGHTQNASIFSKRLGALRKQCGNAVDFVFVDAPMILKPADLFGASSPAALDASEAGGVLPGSEARAWWTWSDHKTEAIGLPESLAFIRDVLKARRFDGVLGFSQGAAFAALISALLEKPDVYPPFLVDGKAPHPPFAFCISVSGFRLFDTAIAAKVYTTPYATPTLHIMGRNDIIVIEERSRKLVAISTNARVEEHDGGHFLPSKTSWRKFLAAYIQNPGNDVPSPSLLASESTDNSGAATPVEVEVGVPQMKL